MITIDDFKKIELRVATIKNAERVVGSEKLLKLTVDVAGSERQVLAGIGKAYEPASIIDRQIIIVANLEPRSLLGLESQGMLLAASGDEGPVLLIPEKPVTSGSEIR